MVRSLGADDLGYQTIRKTLIRNGEFTSDDGRVFRFYFGDTKPNYVPNASKQKVASVPVEKATEQTGRPKRGVSKMRELALMGDY